MRERQNFFKSAEEILTMEQMGKLVVFEEKFRNEVSGLLFRERKKKREKRLKRTRKKQCKNLHSVDFLTLPLYFWR